MQYTHVMIVYNGYVSFCNSVKKKSFLRVEKIDRLLFLDALNCTFTGACYRYYVVELEPQILFACCVDFLFCFNGKVSDINRELSSIVDFAIFFLLA